VRAFRNRDFAVFWSGALASNIGSWVQNMAVPYVLYEITQSAFWVGFATFAQFAPQMLLGPLGGSIADKADRRRVLMTTQALMAVTAFLLWAAWALGLHELPLILGLVTLSGVINGVNIPSWQAFVNDLLPMEDMISGITLNSLQFNASRAIGPAIAGVILATAGPGLAFLANGMSFVFVLVALALVRARPPRPPKTKRGGVLKRFAQAIRYTRRQRGISTGIIVAMLIGSLGNPVQSFTVVFAASEYHVGPIGLALLNVTLGVGAVGAFFAVSGWDHVATRGTMVRWALIVYGTAIVSFSLAPSIVLGMIALAFVGGGFLAVISITNTAVQVIVADHVRGRVMAFRVMAFSGSFPIGALIQGWVADQIGVRATICAAGTTLLLATWWLSVDKTRLASLDDPHDETPPDPALLGT
jgi:MFS family permease